MDPNELIKAAPAIAKGAGALAAAIPLTPIIKAILGPAADELGQRFGDRVRLYRYGRSVGMLKKAEKMAKDAGFTPKAVPIKLLFPLLEGASFEEDESLHDMWAALLANAASGDYTAQIRPSFISILRQMASDEAALLNSLYSKEAIWELDHDAAAALYDRLGFGPKDSLTNQLAESIAFVMRFGECRDCLEAANLIGFLDLTEKRLLVSTSLGAAFVRLCRPPKN